MQKSTEPFATSVDVIGRTVSVHLATGEKLNLPIQRYPRLRRATAEQLKGVRLRRNGEALRWDDIDEDIQVASIVAKRWPTHGGARAGAGRKRGDNRTTNARVNKELLKRIQEEVRATKVGKSQIFDEALRLRYLLVGTFGGKSDVKEIALSDIGSLQPLRDSGYTKVRMQLLKKGRQKRGTAAASE